MVFFIFRLWLKMEGLLFFLLFGPKNKLAFSVLLFFFGGKKKTSLRSASIWWLGGVTVRRL